MNDLNKKLKKLFQFNINKRYSSSNDTFISTINNGLLFNNQYNIPPEILPLILSNVDAKTLYKQCTLVCKQWNAIIKGYVWKLKCEQELMKDNEGKYKLQLLRQKQYPYNVYQTISVFKQSFYTNLIKNPCGMDGFNYWVIDRNDVSSFTIEDCKLFDNNICEINQEMISSSINKCFTTSFDSCKIQIIDLCKQTGLTQQFIDKYQPPIYISEWYGSRRDSQICFYELRIMLFDADYKEIKRCNCNYLFEYEVEQGEGFFQKVQHVFKNYGKNVRFVYFCHTGVGLNTQLWVPYYGTKFTNANVQFFYPNDTHLDHVIDEHTQESYHKDCKKYCTYSDFERDIIHHSANKYEYKNKYLK